MVQMMALCVLGALGGGPYRVGHGELVRKVLSPDRRFLAKIITVSPADHHPGVESCVEIWNQAGRIVARRSYASWDGEHGYGVAQAAWTQNSRIFVWRLESSGGHSPWHSPIDFWARRRNRIYSLDGLVHDAVIAHPFTLNGPDRITLRLKGKTVIEGTPCTLGLEKLLRASREGRVSGQQ
ncbi:MAG: hypothetical protein ACP5VE_03640 [Chthonomonadales bacterium]